ncbi:conjugal transfer protein TraG N-terminal domain-containing protein, partial [Klebsiella pneumoniae]|uniref:conjugal transfer protein TraG N-terminal domain-containing protein n=1 Tax=Klebsiella pneumoniae TaxID=573 RepID=UPI000A4D76C5
MLEIYAIAGGDWLRGNLNAIAAFMGTSTWSTIEKMCIAISVLIVAGNWVKKHNVMDLIGWVFSLTLVSMLVVIRTPVQIIDYSNVAQVYEVDNVPIGLAIPASLTSAGTHCSRMSEMIWSRLPVNKSVRHPEHLRIDQVFEYRNGGAGDKPFLLIRQFFISHCFILD